MDTQALPPLYQKIYDQAFTRYLDAGDDPGLAADKAADDLARARTPVDPTKVRVMDRPAWGWMNDDGP